MRKDYPNNGNLKPVWDLHVEGTDLVKYKNTRIKTLNTKA